MPVNARLMLDEATLARFCVRHHIRRLALFGSVLKGVDRPDSDVDLLVEFEPGQEPGLLALADMEDGALRPARGAARRPAHAARPLPLLPRRSDPDGGGAVFALTIGWSPSSSSWRADSASIWIVTGCCSSPWYAPSR